MDAIKNITITDNIKGITYNLTTYRVDSIDINDVHQTYMGKTGCACGCNGDYTIATDNLALTQRRINKIWSLRDTDAVYQGSSYMSWENEESTRATRIYFNDEISYDYDRYAGLTKTIRTNIDNA